MFPERQCFQVLCRLSINQRSVLAFEIVPNWALDLKQMSPQCAAWTLDSRGSGPLGPPGAVWRGRTKAGVMCVQGPGKREAESGPAFPIPSSSSARLCSRDLGFRDEAKGSSADGHSVAPALTQVRVREPRDREQLLAPDAPRRPPSTGPASRGRTPVSHERTRPTGCALVGREGCGICGWGCVRVWPWPGRTCSGHRGWGTSYTTAVVNTAKEPLCHLQSAGTNSWDAPPKQ